MMTNKFKCEQRKIDILSKIEVTIQQLLEKRIHDYLKAAKLVHNHCLVFLEKKREIKN